MRILTEGVLVYIIDYSLARFKNADGDIVYRDLSSEKWLFDTIDSEGSQYKVYREMREVMQDNWKCFNPRTNVIWLKFIVTSLIQRLAESKKKGLIFEYLNDMLPQMDSCVSVSDLTTILRVDFKK